MTRGWVSIAKDGLRWKARIIWMSLLCNPGVVELRRAGWGFAVLEPPANETPTIASVAPPCLDASEGESFEDELWDNQMQEDFDLDLAAATTVEGDVPVGHSREPRLSIGHFGCVAGDHSSACRTHVSPSCGAACCAILEGRWR